MRRIVILVLFLLAGCAYVHLLRVPDWTATLAATLCSPLFDLAAGHISPRTASLFLTGTQALVVVALFAGLTQACKRAWSRAWAWAGLPDGVIVAMGMWVISQRQRLHDWSAELPPPLRDLLRKPSFWGAACGVALLCTIIAVTLFWTSVSDFLGGSLAPSDDASSTRTTPLEIIYKLSLIIGGFTAFGLAAWRGWCHDVQTRTTAQGHITDRFIEAAKLLGSEQMASRLGGIFMLWRTGKDSKNTDDKRAVLDMLCAFIREPTMDASCDGDSLSGKAKVDGNATADAKGGNAKSGDPGTGGTRVDAPSATDTSQHAAQRDTMRNDVRAAVSLLSKESTDAFPLPPNYGFDLTGAQLPELELTAAPLSYARLSKANLVGAFLGWSDFTDALLWETDLTQANLVGANLAEANLADAKLTRANLTGATLTKANLMGANLTLADLTLADLMGANLAGASLAVVDLTGADLTGADLTRADLAGADLMRANLTKANLMWANLTKADLTEANLTKANLVDADLTHANFTRANLTQTNLTRANLTGVYLAQTILVDAFVSPEPTKGTPDPARIPFTREHCADAATIEGAIFTGDFSDWPRPETASDGTPPAPRRPPHPPRPRPPARTSTPLSLNLYAHAKAPGMPGALSFRATRAIHHRAHPSSARGAVP